MAKIKTGGHVMEASTFISSTDATSVTLLNQGSLTVGGVTTVTGTSLSDSISLNLPTTFKPSDVTLDTFSTFNFDTKSTSAFTTDYLTGSTGSDNITLSNTGTAAAANVRYTSSGGTDTLNLTANADKITLATAFTGSIDSNGGSDSVYGSSAVDTITLVGATNLRYQSGSTTVTDLMTGSSLDDSVTLLSNTKFDYTTGGGSDSITGSTGADTIILHDTGSTGFNITGGLGADSITLATGAADTINFNSKSDSTLTAQDIISSFNAGTSSTAVDTLAFNNFQLGTFNYLGVGAAFTGDGLNSEARALSGSGKIVIEIDVNADAQTDMVINLLGVTATNIDTTDFSWT